MSLHRLLPLLALGLNLLLLGVAFAPDRRSPRNQVFAGFVAMLAVWNLGVFGLRSTASPETALLWEWFLHVGVIAVPVLFYHYVIVFLDAPRRDRTLIVGYAACGFFWLITPTSVFLEGVTVTGWGFMPDAGPLYPCFFLYFNSYMILGLHRLVRARRSMASSFMRNRALLVITGVMLSLLGGFLDLARFIFGWEVLYPPGIPANAVMALALGIAVLRYRLMDVRLLAKRVIGYLLTAVILSPALLMAILVLRVGLSQDADRASWVAEMVARDAPVLCLAFVLALPLLSRVGTTLDRVMLRRQRGVRDALVTLGNDLPQLIDRQRLADQLTTALVTQIPAAHVSLHVVEDGGDDLHVLAHVVNERALSTAPPRIPVDLAAWLALSGRPLVVEETTFYGDALTSLKSAIAALERARVTLLLPLITESRLAAVLCVGEKLSGEIYEGDEIELLETLLKEAGIALQNARLYADLERQLDELRRTQDQLTQSAKLAAIGELAAGIAHEVNNPLTIIIGHAQLLRRRAELAAVHPAIETIEAQAGRAANMVRGMLDFSRRRPRNLQNVSLRDVIERALTLVTDKLHGRGIETATILDASDPAVFGDRDELTQVFINLVSNAADAMPNGGRLLVCTDVQRRDDVTYVSAQVADTGIGIAAAQRDQIFESFFTTKPEGKGTGLGLTITRDIVKNHEGTIEVDSAVGKGTTMIVNLPLATPDTRAERAQMRVARPAQ
jgi:signal transduction histidine kinase